MASVEPEWWCAAEFRTDKRPEAKKPTNRDFQIIPDCRGRPQECEGAMGRWWHVSNQPKRLTDFCLDLGRKDGAGASTTTGHARPIILEHSHSHLQTSNAHKENLPDYDDEDSRSSVTSNSMSPEDHSPVKSRQRLSHTNSSSTHTEVSSLTDTAPKYNLSSTAIETFPISNQPLSDATMREMLLSLRNTLNHDIDGHISKLKTDLH